MENQELQDIINQTKEAIILKLQKDNSLLKEIVFCIIEVSRNSTTENKLTQKEQEMFYSFYGEIVKNLF